MKETIRNILITLNRSGFTAYIVGGSVRDSLLDRPCKDADITTNATPAQVKSLFPHAEFVGAHFGISLVLAEDGEHVEVATFRTDGCYSDSRRPDSVAFTTDVREDLARRDFTVNALLMDENDAVLDIVGGLDDIAKKQIRAVGEPTRRFQEDALRMLRAVRFACTLDLKIEPNTAIAITNNAHRVENISAERVSGEMNKILTSGRAAEGVELLSDLGLLNYIMPEVELLVDCPQNPIYHPEGNVYNHSLLLLKQLLPGCSLTLALGALLHDIGKPAALKFKDDGSPVAYEHEKVGIPIARDIMTRLKYPNEVIQQLLSHVENHMTFAILPKMKRSKQLSFIGQPNIHELLELHRLDRLAASGDLVHYYFAKTLIEETPAEVVHPPKLVTGADLIQMGLKPGAIFREILDQVAEEQLEGTLTTREDALRRVEETINGLR